MIDGRAQPDAASAFRAFIAGVGDKSDTTRYRVSEVADQIGRRQGIIADDERLFHHPWRPRHDFAKRLCPDLLPWLYDERDNQGLQITRILDPCANESMISAFPSKLGIAVKMPRRIGLIAYTTDDALAYIHPFQYQVLSADASATWLSASPRYLSRASVPAVPVERVDRKLIIVQDRFNFSNIAHFLLDGVSRVLLYADNFGINGDETFVFGGVPTDYHALLCEMLCTHLALPAESLLFPETPRLLRGRSCCWFSDQIEGHQFPAQMAHPHAIDKLFAFCRQAPVDPGPHKRLYISRGDASQRRISNEPELITALTARGFVSVQLAGLPAAQQIALFKGADFIIGPHGQGLAQIVMGHGIGRLIELFHPSNGNDCYAWIARGAGIDYDWSLGTPIPDSPADFHVDISHILGLVGAESPSHPASFRKPANLVPASRTFAGFVSEAGSVPAYSQEQMIWGQHAIHHQTKVAPTSTGSQVCGQWSRIETTPLFLYTASCWVSIPSRSNTTSVEIGLADCSSETRTAADVTRRDNWQRISTTAMSAKTGYCDIQIILDAESGGSVLSTCWQLEKGTVATAYVPTG